MTRAERIFDENTRLSRAEYLLRHSHLHSMPRCLGLVLSNACNIDCVHCYQPKNGDNLLRPAAIGNDLRRELSALYPYVSTLRVQGGEVFALPGFREMVEDVAATVPRPVLSVSTNGTLIDDDWAELLVRARFVNITVSIDAATPATFAKLRRGAQLGPILANIERVAEWRRRLDSPWPVLDSFFVIMRSNFREIPAYLDLMWRTGVQTVSLQTFQPSEHNVKRTLTLIDDEMVTNRTETVELHAILKDALTTARRQGRIVRVSGPRSLFEIHGLETRFLDEESDGLYPDSDGLATPGGFDLCPNPWTTLFVTEDGDARLCFLSDPIGNLYQAPLAVLWNSPAAQLQRSRMVAGRYLDAGCNGQYCAWRDGKAAPAPEEANVRSLIDEMRHLVNRAASWPPVQPVDTPSSPLGAVRRMVASKDRRIAELETIVRQFEELANKGQGYVDHLEARVREADAMVEQGQQTIDHLEWKAEKAVRDFMEARAELDRRNRPTLIRIARKLVGANEGES